MALEPERIELEVEPLTTSEREELITRLEHQLGVVSAWFDAGDPRRLIVHVEPDRFTPVTLLDFVLGQGVGARLGSAGPEGGHGAPRPG